MLREIDKRVGRALNAVRTAFRGVLKSVKKGAIQSVVGEGLAGEDIVDSELMQHFGFRSVPPSGTQAVIIPLGGKSSHGVVIATEHGDFAVQQLESGETVVYNEWGAKITLKKDKIIDVDCDEYNVRCKKYNVQASDGASFETPTLKTSEIMQSQSIAVLGGGAGSSFGGNFNHSSGSFVSNGVVLHMHTHTDSISGTTSKPN